MAGIAISGLSKRLGRHQALHRLDLAIRPGEFVTLLGPSGCGKTTTLRLLAGFMAPDEGEIRVDDRLLSTAAAVVPPERRRMGMVFQNYALWPHMTVAENVAFGLRMQRLARPERARRAEAALALVGLAGLGGRNPAMLSGGQQQRVALARSLVVEPDILLLDEPLSNLDVKLRERMRGELKELQRRTGITFVYVTHDQAEAIALSDRIAMLDGGVLLQFATPIEIYERPANRFVADFVGAANLLEGTVAAPGRVALDAGGGLTMELPGGLPVGAAVTVMLRPEDIEIGAESVGDAVNGLAATVADAALLGQVMEYRVSLNGTMLRVHAPRRASCRAGDAVVLSVRPEHCVLVP